MQYFVPSSISTCNTTKIYIFIMSSLVILIFSATSAFRMMNYGCGCKFCFFPCMCCCQIPIGGNSVQPETVAVYPASYQTQQPVYSNNQPSAYSTVYPQNYQSYPTRYSSSTDSSTGSDSYYGGTSDLNGKYIESENSIFKPHYWLLSGIQTQNENKDLFFYWIDFWCLKCMNCCFEQCIWQILWWWMILNHSYI